MTLSQADRSTMARIQSMIGKQDTSQSELPLFAVGDAEQRLAERILDIFIKAEPRDWEEVQEVLDRIDAPDDYLTARTPDEVSIYDGYCADDAPDTC